MSRAGRKLSPEEAALWARLARTVVPLSGREVSTPPVEDDDRQREERPPEERAKKAARARPVVPVAQPPAARPGQLAACSAQEPSAKGLDASWDRKLARGLVQPDFTLDLHGASLSAAHGRLLHGLAQAKAMGARVVLLIAGKSRPVEAADRGQRRGAIRANVIDWIAHSEHAHDVAAIRGAHRRHGGAGALYIVLRKRRA